MARGRYLWLPNCTRNVPPRMPAKDISACPAATWSRDSQMEKLFLTDPKTE